VLVAREIVGSRHAILAAAGRILGASEAEYIDIEIPASDAEMVFLAETLGCVGRRAGMHGTLKIIDPAAFLSALRPPVDAPSMAPEDAAAFVFGSVERNAPLARPGVFPLPLPCYGLNYV
jgi:hypothetical protein